MVFWVYHCCSHNALISPSKAQRMLKATRNSPQLLFRNYNHSLLLYFLVVDLRLFLVNPTGIRRASVATMERILRKMRLARSNQVMSSWPGHEDGQKGSRTQKACHLCIIHLLTLQSAPKGTCSGLDFDEFNLAFAQGSERAEWD